MYDYIAFIHVIAWTQFDTEDGGIEEEKEEEEVGGGCCSNDTDTVRKTRQSVRGGAPFIPTKFAQ